MAQRETPVLIGDEDLDEEALKRVETIVRSDERVVALSGFDFGTEVIAVTDRRVIITGRDGRTVFNSYYDSIDNVTQNGRTLELYTTSSIRNQKHQMGRNETVEELARTINQQKRLYGSGSTGSSPSQMSNDTPSGPEGPPGIAERVRFWEEQDRINQELIPRVVRQAELLASHVGEHENLQLAAARAVNDALRPAREELDTELQKARAERNELAEELTTSRTEREGLAQQLSSAHSERVELESQLTNARLEREELGQMLQSNQANREKLEAELERTAAERAKLEENLEQSEQQREDQERKHAEEVGELRSQRTRINRLAIAISSAAAATALAALFLTLI